jgi:hypothetical protein
MRVGNCYTVEARWDKTHESVAEMAFFVIDQVGGGLDDAKRTAKSYLDAHVAQTDCSIEWVEGICRGAKCTYGRTPYITFRITW